jgi:hypothetical protein
MKPALMKLYKAGRRTAKIQATYRGMHHGNLIFQDVITPAGSEDHVWMNPRASAALPDLQKWDRVQFLADLQAFRKTDGSQSIRLECAREAVILPKVA